jgi:hypothetical protein
LQVAASVYFAADPPPDAVLAGALAALLSPVVGVGDLGTALPASIAGAILADKADRLAERIRGSPHPVRCGATLSNRLAHTLAPWKNAYGLF